MINILNIKKKNNIFLPKKSVKKEEKLKNIKINKW